MLKRIGAAWLLAGACLSGSGLTAPQTGWEYYGGDSAGTRYSSLNEINRGNVKTLQKAWIYSTGEVKRRGAELIANSSTETTPILVDDRLIFCTPFNRIVALEPATGRELWVYDAHVDLNQKLPYHYNCRGVSVWRDATASGAECAVRLFMGTNDSRLIAVDAHTGKPCSGFGQGGAVAVPRERPSKWPGEIKISSAPLVANGVVAVGSFVMDNLRVDAPLGTVFAFDARSGELRWKFETIPQDPADPASATWLEGSAARTGAANVWSTMVADEARGLIFAPVGSASPDFWGGTRKGDNLYSSSLVALDSLTGKVRWHFQSVHHDIWDYDVSSPPMLIDIRRPDRTIPAVVQNTKQGFSFVFERDTGKPVFGVVERPVPQKALPGEWLSPTQPYPVLPEPLVPLKVTPEDAWGFTFWDKQACKKKIEGLRSEGIFTPVDTIPGTILSPGSAGGMNWGGPAYDAARQLMIVNVNRVAQVAMLVPRKDIPGVEGIRLTAGNDVAAQTGTPYGTRREWLLSPWGAPCTAPPWGELVAVSMLDGRVKWRVPLGSIEKSLPIKFEWNLGTPNLGGPIVTGGGLIFIAATMDQYLRAFDIDSGKMLWREEMPAGTQTTPITYQSNGRQFIALVTGHHLWFNSTAGDDIVAYSLPSKQ